MRQEWKREFGTLLPQAGQLRERLSERWCRIHSLPDSKRYPENAAEREQLLRRQLAVANDVLGPAAPCFAYCCRYARKEGEPSRESVAGLSGVAFAELWRATEPTGLGEDPGAADTVAVLGAVIDWNPSLMRPVLLAIAEDQDRLLFLSQTTHRIFAPYDGGVDVILRDGREVEQFRQRFAPWLSPRPDGL